MTPVKAKQESFKIEFGIFAGIDYFSRKTEKDGACRKHKSIQLWPPNTHDL